MTKWTDRVQVNGMLLLSETAASEWTVLYTYLHVLPRRYCTVQYMDPHSPSPLSLSKSSPERGDRADREVKKIMLLNEYEDSSSTGGQRIRASCLVLRAA